MSEIKDGGPAFPVPIAGCNDGGVYNTLEQSGGKLGGMSLRDYFAAKAMQGMLASPHANPKASMMRCAMESYAMADAMLAMRQK